MVMVIVKGEGAVLGLNLGHPIVPMGILMCSCAEICEPIELSFREVSWVGCGMGVLDGGPRAPMGRGSFSPHLFQWCRGLFV